MLDLRGGRTSETVVIKDCVELNNQSSETSIYQFDPSKILIYL